MMKEIVASENSIYHTQGSVKMLKVQSCKFVYDASTRENSRLSGDGSCTSKPSMEHPITTRFKSIVLCGYLQKAFLQIQIKNEDRDALRFHWVRKDDPNQIKVLRLTKLVFGLLVQSHFILEGTIDKHRSSYTERYRAKVAEIRDDLYVDGLITGGKNFEQVVSLKDIAIEIFHEAGFKFHRCHSNTPAM